MNPIEEETFIRLSADKSKFEIFTNNRTFVGEHELTVSVVMSSNEKI